MRRAVTAFIAGLIITVVLLPFAAWGLALTGGWDTATLAFLLAHATLAYVFGVVIVAGTVNLISGLFR